MHTFWFELGAAWQTVLRRPGFSALAVLVLAAGLASALSIASFLNTLVLNPLPFADSGQLYRGGLIDNDDDLDTRRYDLLAANDFLDWRERLDGLATVAAYSQQTSNLGSDGISERYAGARISADLLGVLGVAPQLGRGFVAADEIPGAPAVVLLSDAVWRQRFDADPGVLGSTIRINARPATVIGVMPAQFSYPWRERLWQPLQLSRGEGEGECCFDVVLRPRAGVSGEQIKAALDSWFIEASERDPEAMRSRARAVGFDLLKYQFVDRETITLFSVMAVAVGLVLLIACANVANLLLGGLLARERELALRSAIGATRGRLLLGLLLQSGLLSLIALLISLPLAQLGVQAVVAEMQASTDNGPPHWMVFAIDSQMLAIAAGCALLTALLSGILPALHAAARRDLDLRGASQGGGGFARLSQWLMVGQVAFSLAVLMATALLVQTVRQLDQFDLGLDTHSVLTARIGVMPERFSDPRLLTQQVDTLLEAIREEPGVLAATASSSLPGLMGANEDVLEFGTAKPATGYQDVGYSAVDPSFFETLRAERVAGRLLEPTDSAEAEPVMVVDQTFVDRYLGGGDAIGRRFVLDPEGGTERVATIVGVVRPVQMDDIDDPREASVFVPFAQSPQRFFSLMVRTREAPMGMAQPLAAIAQRLDPDSPLYWVRPYDDVLFEATIGQHLLARMFTSFGIIALLLAASGLYGVIAFNVGRRTREIGVRRALGAANGLLLSDLLRGTLGQVLIGLCIGLVLGIPFASLLSGMLGTTGLEASGMSWRIWLPALIALASAALVACWVPARRALRIEPTVALRQD